jgi:hypothetical protein
VGLADDACATIFLAGILARMEGPILWCLRWRDLFAPALHLAGLHPDRVIHVEAGNDANLLLAMEECLRHAGLAGVVGEVAKYSTTASKRLQLAAEGSGVPAFVFRRASRAEVAIEGTAAIQVMKSAVRKAKLGETEELAAVRRLDEQARRLEATATGPSVAELIESEGHASHSYGGRSVFGWQSEPSAATGEVDERRKSDPG